MNQPSRLSLSLKVSFLKAKVLQSSKCKCSEYILLQSENRGVGWVMYYRPRHVHVCWYRSNSAETLLADRLETHSEGNEEIENEKRSRMRINRLFGMGENNPDGSSSIRRRKKLYGLACDRASVRVC